MVHSKLGIFLLTFFSKVIYRKSRQKSTKNIEKTETFCLVFNFNFKKNRCKILSSLPALNKLFSSGIFFRQFENKPN